MKILYSDYPIGACTWRRALLFGVAAMLVMPTGLAPAMAQGEQAAPVEIDRVRTEPLSQTMPVLGRFVARRSGVVATRVKGPVAEIRVAVGDRVKTGDVLAVLTRHRLQGERDLRSADVQERAAELATSKAEQRRARQEFARLERLKKSKSAAFQEARYDDKRVEVSMMDSEIVEAQARLNRAEAQLRLATIDLDDAVIKAPYPGVVSQRYIQAGAYVNVGEPVVTLIDDNALEIEADVPAHRIGGLTRGLPVQASIAGETFRASVRAVVPEENPLTRTRAVRFAAEFQSKNGTLAANQAVTVNVPIGAARDVVTVHKDAVLTRSGQRIVFLVAEDKRVSPATVTLGDSVGGRFVVIEGLKPGDLVVVRGNERLRPNQLVAFEPPK